MKIDLIITVPAGTYIPEPWLRELLSVTENGRVHIVGDLRTRSVAMLEKFSEENDRINYIPAEHAAVGNCLQKMLTESIDSKAELSVIIDARPRPSKAVLLNAIKEMLKDQDRALAYPAATESSMDMVLDMLQGLSHPAFVVLRNTLIANELKGFSGLAFCFLPEWLLYLSTVFPPLPVPMGGITNAPIQNRNDAESEQRVMDEEWKILEKYIKMFFKRTFKWIPIKELVAEYSLSLGRAMPLLQQLKSGTMESMEEYDRSIFRYCLLAIYIGEIDNARELLSASFTLISERVALMRLYKQLILCFPIQEIPVHGQDKVSVVIPLFNQGHYLEEAVVSVVNQTYTNWEICIIDDGSTDDSYKVATRLVEKLGDDRIRLFTQQNRGKGATRNRGMRETEGKYVITLDSDDLIAPDYLAVAVRMMKENPRAAWITPKTLVFGKDNHIWNREFSFPEMVIISPSPSSSLLRREALEEICFYREDLTNREDAEIWLSLMERGWVSVNTKEPLFFYRHACRRPGLNDISNIPSKEEITSLHPWWFRRELGISVREKAFTEFSVYRFGVWFINWDNINKVLPHFNNRESFVEAINELKSDYPEIVKPCRWKSENEECYLEAREALYGVRSFLEER